MNDIYDLNESDEQERAEFPTKYNKKSSVNQRNQSQDISTLYCDFLLKFDDQDQQLKENQIKQLQKQKDNKIISDLVNNDDPQLREIQNNDLDDSQELREIQNNNEELLDKKDQNANNQRRIAMLKKTIKKQKSYEAKEKKKLKILNKKLKIENPILKKMGRPKNKQNLNSVELINPQIQDLTSGITEKTKDKKKHVTIAISGLKQVINKFDLKSISDSFIEDHKIDKKKIQDFAEKYIIYLINVSHYSELTSSEDIQKIFFSPDSNASFIQLNRELKLMASFIQLNRELMLLVLQDMNKRQELFYPKKNCQSKKTTFADYSKKLLLFIEYLSKSKNDQSTDDFMHWT